MSGRSPLTRGSPTATAPVPSLAGSVPAHAGEPRPWWGRSRPRRVDPRSRGGAGQPWPSWHRWTGRSPLTRGSPMIRTPAAVTNGSIPAHAGEPGQDRDQGHAGQVDPRSRGGAAAGREFGPLSRGRSPLTRGSPSHEALVMIDAGSIPAHAGEPSHECGSGSRWQVDPRSRGGAPTFSTSGRPRSGRSPLTRGSPSASHPHQGD